MPEFITKHILLVEDEALLAMAEKMELEKYGYAVRTVKTGEKAVEAVQSSSDIDLILMDINLGRGIDGTQAAEIILKDHDLPIVFLSSHKEPELVEKTEKITSYGYVAKSSSVTVLDASIKMAFKLFYAHIRLEREIGVRLRAETESKKNAALYRSLMENSIDAVYLLSETGNVRNVNAVACEMLGYTRDELIALTIDDIDPNYPSRGFLAFWADKPEGSTVLFQSRHKRKDGAILDVEVNGIFFVLDGQKHLFGVARDITERKIAEERLRENEHRLRLGQQIAKLGDFAWDVTTGEVTWSDGLYELLGYDKSEKIDYARVNKEIHHPDDLERVTRWLNDCIESGDEKLVPNEYRLVRKDKEFIYVNAVGIIERTVYGHTKVFATIQDITERKQAEEEIRKQLTEKETLLREVHHRVKNNIATIESLLLLQLAAADSPEVVFALQNAISRVQSMRVLHEKLLVSKDVGEISIRHYAESLIDSLVKFFDPERNITVETHIADFDVAATKAISIGIIMNELLTNAFKYAFRDRDNGMVSVFIAKEEDNVTLIIQDDGSGIDESAMENKPPGFGLTLVKMLVEQLGGTYRVVNENGTKTIVQFE